MFSFFRKKKPAAEPAPAELPSPDTPGLEAPASSDPNADAPWPARPPEPVRDAEAEHNTAPELSLEELEAQALAADPARAASDALAAAAGQAQNDPKNIANYQYTATTSTSFSSETEPAETDATVRTGWLNRLRTGLRKTGSGISVVFTGAKIDEALYEDLETALLMADAGVAATSFLLDDLRRRVKDARATDPAQVKGLLADAITDLLKPLEKTLVVGEYHPTVIMVAGVNGAGKTTSIGKLTRHLAGAGASVLLAAADTFRAAAREQLAVWAGRNQVEIISQQGADPSAVAFDAVAAGRSRRTDVVLVDTAGRLPTQKHLMEELTKIRRVVTKADVTAPHEVLLVIDGNTGQNALAQVKAFDEAIRLTGLVVTKLDGTAKGGVLAAIAREKPVPVYFVGVGEKLEDLQTFSAREFAQALLGA